MKQRTISAIILLIVLVSALVISSTLFGIVMTVFAVIGFNELFQVKFKDDLRLRPVNILGILLVIFICLNNLFYKVDINVSIIENRYTI